MNELQTVHERERLKKAKALNHDKIFTYWVYPAPARRSWQYER
ncbi:MAG: hypothetical protein WCJ76_07505 [Comamonadaceae bacterium]